MDFEERPRDAVIWHDPDGQAQGFIIYGSPGAREPMRHELVVHDMVALTPDAYLGLWQYLASHDIAVRIHTHAPLDDPFPDLLQDPWRVQIERGEGAMVRIVDVERALSGRPFVGRRPVSFTMRIEDSAAPWNDGVWRVDAAEGRMETRRSDDIPDVELSVNFLAPLFTGFVRADVAAATGMIRVRNPDALGDVAEAFAATYPPYCHDFY
jgi:predicted acetyltransferase